MKVVFFDKKEETRMSVDDVDQIVNEDLGWRVYCDTVYSARFPHCMFAIERVIG